MSYSIVGGSRPKAVWAGAINSANMLRRWVRDSSGDPIALPPPGGSFRLRLDLTKPRLRLAHDRYLSDT
jgi:hypothetical protein